MFVSIRRIMAIAVRRPTVTRDQFAARLNNASMTLVEHLTELRYRVVKMLQGVFVGMAACILQVTALP